MDLIILFVGGLTCALALAVGMLRPWRGLLLLWTSGVILAVEGPVPGLSVAYVTMAAAVGTVALLACELITRHWYRRYEDAIQAGKQWLTCTLAALLSAGVFLGPLWGVLLAGVAGTLGGACFATRRHLTAGLARGVFFLCMRGAALLITAALLTGRLLGLF
ncbi:hypothetical protein MHOCP_16450 [Moorella humiferrea]|uniref:hypothetical protein n=1 Tax=Neomoorella humiferrea TaxID=676965 RepID=UPI0030D1F3DF